MPFLGSKYAKMLLRPGLCPGPRWGSLQRSPRPPSWIKGGLLLRGGGGEGKRKGRERERRRGKWRGGERRGGEGKGDVAPHLSQIPRSAPAHVHPQSEWAIPAFAFPAATSLVPTWLAYTTTTVQNQSVVIHNFVFNYAVYTLPTLISLGCQTLLHFSNKSSKHYYDKHAITLYWQASCERRTKCADTRQRHLWGYRSRNWTMA